jgi:hypothetical protein
MSTTIHPARTLAVVLATVLLLIGLIGIGRAQAHDPVIGVVPDAVEVTLAPGTSTDVTKTVHTPEIPPTPDIFLLFDTTGSMGDDLDTVKAEASALIAAISGPTTDPAFGVGTYEDFPFATWGISSDEAYELVLPISTNTTDVTNAINSVTLGNGFDTPESGYEGLYQALTGAGRDLPQPDGSAPDGDFADAGEILPGLDAGFRVDASQVIILLGDAAFHNPGDAPVSTQFAAGYPGAGAADVSGALGDVSLFCLLPDSLEGVGPEAQCDGLGATTFDAGTSSEDIVAAIIATLGEVEVEVTPQASCGDPSITISWDVASQTVTTGEDAIFVETIAAGAAAPQGTTVTCSVDFLVDGEVLDGFTQSVTVNVPDVTAPLVTCAGGTNPHGATVPPAANQNPDGFYALTATDNVDPDPQIFVVDSGSGTVFGPYPSGTTIKYVEANGATPNEKPMGSANGAAGAVTVKITGTGDALVFAVDSAGNASAPVSCLVPPPPR